MKNTYFHLRPKKEILSRRGLQDGGRAQRYVDNEVLRRNAPYLPHESGELEKSGRLGTVVGSGKVIYNTVKGRFLYYGKLMIGERSHSAWAHQNEKKIVTDQDLTYQGGGLRGAFHFERMKTDHKEDILRGVAKVTGGKAK